MRRCRHPSETIALVSRRAGNGYRALHDVCQRCGEWLSLGPSNDDSRAVRAEIRAAELAVTRHGTYCNIDEQCGWICHRDDYDPTPTVEALAGWLAREIEQHDATHSEPT